jgi:hypothetical protein
MKPNRTVQPKEESEKRDSTYKLTSRKSAESTSDVNDVTIRRTGAVSDLFLSISTARSFTTLEFNLELP